MGETNSSSLNKIAQEIWEFLVSKSIMITAEYLPSSLDFQVDGNFSTPRTQPSGSLAPLYSRKSARNSVSPT